MEIVWALLAISLLFAVFGALIATIATADYWYPRLALIVLRRSGLGPTLYPTAVGIAVSIVTHPEQWSSNRVELSHPDIGTVWIANAAYGIHVDTELGRWEPGFLEKRIIREAVDWRLGNYLRDRLEVAVRRNALR